MPTIGSTSKPAYVYDSQTDTWIPIGPGEHTHDYIGKDVITTTGDIIYASAANTPARLGIGSTGQVLKVSGGLPTWGTDIGATLKGCRLVKSSAQATSANAWTAITYDTETFDTDGFHSTSSNTSRITIPAGLGGYYFIWANIQWAANGSGQRGVKIFQDNSQDRWKQFQAANAGYGNHITIADVYNLSAGAYIEIATYQDSGGNLNVLGTADNQGFGVFGAVWLGA